MSEQSIADFFKTAASDHPGMFRILPGYESPLRVLAGIRNGRPELLFSGRHEIPDLESSEAVEVTVEDKGEKGWYLFLSVRDEKYKDLFIRLCDDLLSVISGARSAESALYLMVSRYESWRNFWGKAKSAMTEAKVRGLAGELLYMEYCLDQGRDPGAVIASWIGPLGGDQDFVFEDGWTEVKSVRQGASEVQISSLEQLVNPSVFADSSEVVGRLAILRLHGEPAGDECESLADIYNRILKKMRDYPHAVVNFRNTIEMFGADMQKGHLETRLKLKLLEFKVYDVNGEGFPRLIRNEALPEAITKARYTLSIPALEPWKIEEVQTDGQ